MTFLGIKESVQKEEEVKEKVKQEVSPERKAKVFRTITIVAIFLFIGSLIVAKILIPTFNTILVIILSVIVLLFGLGVIFLPSIIKSFKNKEVEQEKELNRLPKPATLGELRNIAKYALKNQEYANETIGCLGERFVTLPKSRNIIYVYETKAMYTEGMKKGNVTILINAHYPNDRRSILIDKSLYEISKAIRDLGTETEEETPFEEITTYNPTLGIQSSIKKPVPKEKKKLSEEISKEEDL